MKHVHVTGTKKEYKWPSPLLKHYRFLNVQIFASGGFC
jgi:hypothetical protein